MKTLIITLAIALTGCASHKLSNTEAAVIVYGAYELLK